MRYAFLVVAASLSLSGCSSDAVLAPEPAYDQPGAFVAVDDGGEALTLFRTLDTLKLQVGTYLFMTEYDVAPLDWEEAQALAKEPDLPIRTALLLEPVRIVTDNPYQVVWFRTLTDEERERIP